MTIEWEQREIRSEPNIKTLLPQLLKEREMDNYQEQRRTIEANNLGPRRCRLLQWLTTREPRRIRTDYIQSFYQELLLRILLRERTKRILINEQQYQSIARSEHMVPDEVARELRWPFDDHIYIELERAIVSHEEDGRVDLHQGLIILAGPEPRQTLSINTCTQVNWLGCVLGRIDLKNNCHQVMNEDIDRDNFQPAEYTYHIRLLAYMTAKGIEIVEHPIPRGPRRQLERKSLPNPWHVIQVEPKIIIRNQDEEREETDRRHSYRYDVAGHIRFGRHRLRDGTHRSTREWVRPHQRGLAYSRYIPASRRYSTKLTQELEETLEENPEPAQEERPGF